MYLINPHADVSIRARGLNFGWSLHLHPTFVYASNKGLGESMHMCVGSFEPSFLDDAMSSLKNCICQQQRLMVRLHMCAGSFEPFFLYHVMSTSTNCICQQIRLCAQTRPSRLCLMIR